MRIDGSEEPDFDLHTSPAVAPARRTGLPPIAWAGIALLIAALGGGAYFMFGRRAPTTRTAAAPPPVAAGPSPSLGGRGAAVQLPPLEDSDALVREHVRAVSDSPAVAAWLTTRGLVRNLTVVVTNIVDGANPAKQLSVLKPSTPFRVVQRDGRTYIDPRSYDRYTAVADGVASIDADKAAALYSTFKPLIETAYKELGSNNPSFDRALERAITAILATPVLKDPVPLKELVITYAYADDRLENMTPAQKLLMRTGPRNLGLIKAKVRDIAIALGIRDAQLPAR